MQNEKKNKRKNKKKAKDSGNHDAMPALVVGGTGGVGRFAVRSLLLSGLSVRVLTRNVDRAQEFFAEFLGGKRDVTEASVEKASTTNEGSKSLNDKKKKVKAAETSDTEGQQDSKLFARLQLIQGNLTEESDVDKVVEGTRAIICASGGSGPGSNSPYKVDFVGVGNLIVAAKKHSVSSFVLVSSAGITQLFMSLSMNLTVGNYAKWKKRGEEALRESELDYTIVRPTWLVDDDVALPCVQVGQGDTFSVMRTRINRRHVGELCVAALQNRDLTSRVTLEAIGCKPSGDKEGEKKSKTKETKEKKKSNNKAAGPASSPVDAFRPVAWQEIFTGLRPDSGK